MRLFYARVHHFHQNIGVVCEFNHQFLVLLHVSERVFVNHVGVVEEQVVFRSEFNFNVLKIASLSLRNLKIFVEAKS